MVAKIDISDHCLETVRRILRDHLPTDAAVWAFGSRATWTAKDFSDLDLALQGTGPLNAKTILNLKNAFEESTLPWKVDVIDLNTVTPEFRAIIEAKRVRMPVADDIDEDWHGTTLGDAADFLSGGTPRKSEKKYWNGDIPWFSASNMNTRFLSDTEMTISAEGLAAGSQMASQGATLLLVRGSGLFNYIPICFADKPVAFNQDVKCLVPKPHIDPLFLHFWLESKRYFLNQNIGVTGIGAGKFDTDFLKSMPFPVLPMKQQKEIGKFAASFDRKIEVNRRMNETLEAMARAIFKDWFVDFGPTRRKSEGADDPHQILGGLFPCSPDTAEHGSKHAAEIAALFPATFDNNNLPTGWEMKPLDEIAEFLNGLALQKFPADGDDYLPVIKISELRNGITGKSNKASIDIPEKYIIEDGDVVFSWSGSLLQRIWTGGRGALNQHLFKVSSDNVPKWFHYLWVDHHLSNFQMIAASKATTMGHIQRHHLTEASVNVPHDSVMKIADERLSPMFQSMLNNDLENKTLANLRDTLLPKLMSGEIHLHTAKKETETI